MNEGRHWQWRVGGVHGLGWLMLDIAVERERGVFLPATCRLGKAAACHRTSKGGATRMMRAGFMCGRASWGRAHRRNHEAVLDGTEQAEAGEPTLRRLGRGMRLLNGMSPR